MQDENAPEIDAYINRRLEQALSEKGLIRETEDPDFVIQTYYTYQPNPNFNPGLKEVRQLICDNIADLVSRYDIDGIHLDDYFYPSADFDDEDTYKAFGDPSVSIGDWRRENVNTQFFIVLRSLEGTGIFQV